MACWPVTLYERGGRARHLLAQLNGLKAQVFGKGENRKKKKSACHSETIAVGQNLLTAIDDCKRLFGSCRCLHSFGCYVQEVVAVVVIIAVVVVASPEICVVGVSVVGTPAPPDTVLHTPRRFYLSPIVSINAAHRTRHTAHSIDLAIKIEFSLLFCLDRIGCVSFPLQFNRFALISTILAGF